LHTASGSPVTYTPPNSLTGNSQTVTIEAFATSDHNQNVATPITVTGFASILRGTYVFETLGSDANSAYQLAGVITLDGNGGITSGEQTHSDIILSVQDPITGGSYYIGPDGRGILTLNTADMNIGQQGVENLSMVVLSSSQALIATLDNANLQSSIETSSGTMDLQTSKAAPANGYAFTVSGIDINFEPMAMGGIINIDSPNTISGNGSVADQDDAGSVFPQAALSGTTGAPDSFGAVKFNLVTDFASAIQFTGYIVDSTHIKMIESDIDGTGAGFGATGGVAFGQGTATGTFTTNKSFANKYVFGILGEDLTGISTSLASAGRFTSSQNGSMSGGYNDEYLAGFGVAISDAFTGTYTIDPSGTGRVDSNINYNINGPGPEFIFYLTGNGNPPLVLDADDNIGSLGAGVAYIQAASPYSFNGKYGLSFTQNSAGTENDGTGQITVAGSSNTLSGVIDTTLEFSPQPNTPLTGTFATIPASGRFSGTLTNTFFPTPANIASTFAVDFYLVDSNHGFFIETDSELTGELTYGYFAPRSPVCPTCP
jgi:hypothetical protein